MDYLYKLVLGRVFGRRVGGGRDHAGRGVRSYCLGQPWRRRASRRPFGVGLN